MSFSLAKSSHRIPQNPKCPGCDCSRCMETRERMTVRCCPGPSLAHGNLETSRIRLFRRWLNQGSRCGCECALGGNSNQPTHLGWPIASANCFNPLSYQERVLPASIGSSEAYEVLSPQISTDEHSVASIDGMYPPSFCTVQPFMSTSFYIRKLLRSL